MNWKKDKVVGILGGIGPEATSDLLCRIIKATPVCNEQEHLRIIVDCNPQIPDRTQAILGKGESPLEELIKTALNLEKAGAEIIAIPCNTAHYYLNEVQRYIHPPIINMISETASYILRQFPRITKAGLLATTGTVKTQIYVQYLKPCEVLVPDDKNQKELMDTIYGKKGIKLSYLKGNTRNRVIEIAHAIIENGAEAIIAGCTEISLVLRQKDITVPLVDPMDILALAVVREAKQKQANS
ncbi:aspartate/glutamate racemase family protein [Chloroflexota bacterium]